MLLRFILFQILIYQVFRFLAKDVSGKKEDDIIEECDPQHKVHVDIHVHRVF
jgi:hypothetical protein